MKLGFLTACMPERSLEEIAAWAADNGYEALELAAWPSLGDRPFTASHIKAEAFDDAEHERVRAAENLREAERVFPPLVDYAGERGVKLMIENCVMEGWHPDGYPGNLAYSPELWEWMFSLGLYLNFDPSHLLWLGIDPVEALRPYVGRVAHAHAKDAETFEDERNRFGFFGRTATREEDPWDMGWWRYRIPGLGQVDFTRYVDALYEGGFDGVLSVEHEDPVWGGSPELIEAGLRIAHKNLRGLVVE